MINQQPIVSHLQSKVILLVEDNPDDKVDSLEVLQRLRADERTKHLPVVILTSSNEEQDIINGYNLGVNSYVQKPVEYTQFSEAVGQLGVYWLLLNKSLTREGVA